MACRSLFVATALIALAAACGGGDDGSEATPTTQGAETRPAVRAADLKLFDYDRGAPLRYRDAGRVNKDYPIAIHDVSYASPAGGRITAYLAVPPGGGPFPAVVYLHGSGGGRLDMTPLATWLAGRGAVALSVDSPFARTPAPSVPRGVAGVRKQRDLGVQAVVELRRAIDVLDSLPQVDPERVGFVGYSAGAKSGAMLVGVEPRVQAAVLIAGGAPSIEEVVAAAPLSLKDAVRRLIGATDPARYVGRSRADLQVQIGREDDVVPADDLNALAAAAADADVRRYDAGHDLIAHGPAVNDQLDFLTEKLRIAEPAVRGALTAPPESGP